MASLKPRELYINFACSCGHRIRDWPRHRRSSGSECWVACKSLAVMRFVYRRQPVVVFLGHDPSFLRCDVRGRVHTPLEARSRRDLEVSAQSPEHIIQLTVMIANFVPSTMSVHY